MAQPVIRRACTADVPLIQACVAAAYAKWISVLGYQPYPMGMNYDAVVGDHDVWVATDAGAVAGVLVLIDKAPKLLIDNIAVDPQCQGSGIGRALLDQAQSRAVEGGYEALRLYTNEKMTENRAWYARNGFTDTGREERDDRVIIYMERLVAGGRQ